MQKSSFFHNFSLNPLVSLRSAIMKNIIEVMNLIIAVIKMLKTNILAIMENYRKLWKIII